jgi:hypothetical protein
MTRDSLTDAELWISDEELDQLAVALERLVMRARCADAASAPPE